MYEFSSLDPSTAASVIGLAFMVPVVIAFVSRTLIKVVLNWKR